MLLYQGQTLLRASLSAYLELSCPVAVCLSATKRDEELARELSTLPVDVLRCKRAERGMGETLAEAVECSAQVDSILVALADMPLIRQDTIDRVVACAQPSKIVYPVFEGRRGHPVAFGRDFFFELRSLVGDRGAVDVIRGHPNAIREIDTKDPGIHLDADTPEALAELRRISSHTWDMTSPS